MGGAEFVSATTWSLGRPMIAQSDSPADLATALKYAAGALVVFGLLIAVTCSGENWARANEKGQCPETYMLEDGGTYYSVPVRTVSGKVEHIDVEVGPDRYLFCNEQQTGATTILMTCVVEDDKHVATLRGEKLS